MRALNRYKAVLPMLVRIHAIQSRREDSNEDRIANGYRNDVEVNADLTPPNALDALRHAQRHSIARLREPLPRLHGFDASLQLTRDFGCSLPILAFSPTTTIGSLAWLTAHLRTLWASTS